MAKVKSTTGTKKSRPALTPEGRESQMISLAVDLAEQQLRDGTASSQIISHYLKRSTALAELEIEKVKLENELLKAKTENLRASKSSEEFYKQVLSAIKEYNGMGEQNNEDY